MIGILFEKFSNVLPLTGYSEDSLNLNNYVVVETSRGMEIGLIVKTLFEKQLQRGAQIKLKKLLRYATDDDLKRWNETKEREKKLLKEIKKKLLDLNIPLTVLDVELLFDNSKLIVYYKLPDPKTNLSIKQISKDLTSELGVKIEMYSLNPREQARLMSGFGICGRQICCASFLLEFPHVSVKMLKDMGIALNQSKISGLCGKFLCCLKYEKDTSDNTSEKEGDEENGG